jgi:hypothetical protein
MKPVKRAKLALRGAYHRLVHPDVFDDEAFRTNLAALSEKARGRRVALIGNADSMFARADGELIDSYDIVVRLNRGFIRNHVSQGSRTDVLCLSSALHLRDIHAAFGDVTIVHMNRHRWLMRKDMLEQRRRLVYYPAAAWKTLCDKLSGMAPSTGLMAIDLFHNHLDAGEVRLFGFDWKESKTFYSDALDLTVHDWRAEREMVESWSRRGRLKLPPKE